MRPGSAVVRVTARHFVLWVDEGRTHIATRNAYQRGEAGWRYDEALSVPGELVMELGWEEWQTPGNGPFPAFSAGRLPEIVEWLVGHGYSAVVLEGSPTT